MAFHRGRRPRLAFLASFLFFGGIATALVAIPLWNQVAAVVDRKFAGHRWDFPSRIYSDEFLIHTGQDVVAFVPKTGGVLFFDMMAIPADAAHPQNALKFMNYIMRPEVHAGLTNKVKYANPNKESRKFINPEVAKNPSVFPTSAEMAMMVAPKALSNDVRRLATRAYTSFKTGI